MDENIEQAVRERRSGAAMASLLALYALTTIHHVYGGIADGASDRLYVPFVLLLPLGAAVAALVRFRRTGGRPAAYLYLGIASGLALLLGVVHSAYSHVYKDVLYLAGGS